MRGGFFHNRCEIDFGRLGRQARNSASMIHYNCPRARVFNLVSSFPTDVEILCFAGTHIVTFVVESCTIIPSNPVMSRTLIKHVISTINDTYDDCNRQLRCQCSSASVIGILPLSQCDKSSRRACKAHFGMQGYTAVQL